MQKVNSNLKLSNGAFLEFLVLRMLSDDQDHTIREIALRLKQGGFNTPMGSIFTGIAASHCPSPALGFEGLLGGALLRLLFGRTCARRDLHVL